MRTIVNSASSDGSCVEAICGTQNQAKKSLGPRRLAVPSQLACELFACAFPGDQVLNPFIVGVIFRIWVIGKVHRNVSHSNNGKGEN